MRGSNGDKKSKGETTMRKAYDFTAIVFQTQPNFTMRLSTNLLLNVKINSK